MGKFRIEYLPKLGADIKMVAQGFDTIDSAERYARLNLNQAPYASISMGERRVKDLWRMVECSVCVDRVRSRKMKLSEVPVFPSVPDFAEHLIGRHGIFPRDAWEVAQRRFDEHPLMDNSNRYSVDERGKVKIRGRS